MNVIWLETERLGEVAAAASKQQLRAQLQDQVAAVLPDYFCQALSEIINLTAVSRISSPQINMSKISKVTIL